MKKVSIVAVFLTVALALSGCLNDDGVNFYDEAIPITDILSLPDTLEPGETYSIDFIARIPTSCHSYLGHQTWVDQQESSDSVRVVKIAAFARVQISSDSCRTVNSEREDTKDDFTISSQRPFPATYSIKFWRGRDSEGKDLYHTYSVPLKTEEE